MVYKLLKYIMLNDTTKISKNGIKEAFDIDVIIQKKLFLNILHIVIPVFSSLRAILHYKDLTINVLRVKRKIFTTAIMANPPFY